MKKPRTAVYRTEQKDPASQEILLTDTVASATSVRWNFLTWQERKTFFFFPLEFQNYCLNKLHPQHSEENTKCPLGSLNLLLLLAFLFCFRRRQLTLGWNLIGEFRHLYFLGPISLIFYLQHCCHLFFLHNW